MCVESLSLATAPVCSCLGFFFLHFNKLNNWVSHGYSCKTSLNFVRKRVIVSPSHLSTNPSLYCHFSQHKTFLFSLFIFIFWGCSEIRVKAVWKHRSGSNNLRDLREMKVLGGAAWLWLTIVNKNIVFGQTHRQPICFGRAGQDKREPYLHWYFRIMEYHPLKFPVDTPVNADLTKDTLPVYWFVFAARATKRNMTPWHLDWTAWGRLHVQANAKDQ